MQCPVCRSIELKEGKVGPAGWQKLHCPFCDSSIMVSPKGIELRKVGSEIIRLESIKEKEGGENEREESEREPREKPERGASGTLDEFLKTLK